MGVQSGLIARNSEDLEALKRLNERNIFDFNLTKIQEAAARRAHPDRPQSTDPKHYRFTMTVVADDKAIEKKDRNVDEPMQFYVHGARAPYEIVVFEVTKDNVTGYLSTPKDTYGLGGSGSGPCSAPAKP